MDVFNPKVLRASMGSIFHIPVIAATSQILLKLKQRGIKVFATYLKAQKLVSWMQWFRISSFCLGNEAKGVSVVDW